MNLGPADGDAAVFGHPEPGRDIGIMVKAGDENFVAWAKFASDGAREGESQRGHILAEDDFIVSAVEEVSHSDAGGGDHGVCAAGRGIVPPGVGIVAPQVVGDGVDDALGNLRPAGAVEKDGGVAVDRLSQRGKLRADVLEVEGGDKGFRRGHRSSISITPYKSLEG